MSSITDKTPQEIDRLFKNLNQMVAVAAGRLDVINGMVNNMDTLDHYNLDKLQKYTSKSSRVVDEMIESHNKGERVVT